jgi:type I restriction enzyme R subunit
VVVSDFDPLGDEERLEEYYKYLKAHTIFTTHFATFNNYKHRKEQVQAIVNMQDSFANYITANKAEAKLLKNTINNYYKILNLIEFVLDLDKKYSDQIFLEFWRKFNYEYNHQNKPKDIIDDVEIYFDNRIGIVAPVDYTNKEKDKKTVKSPTNSNEDNKYKYNILKVIEKRNLEEEAIAELIKEFEAKIEAFFSYIHTDEVGKRLVAKIKDDGTAFSQEEIYQDFAKVYRKYTILNKDLGDFFKREIRDNLNQLYNDFNLTLRKVSKSIS